MSNQQQQPAERTLRYTPGTVYPFVHCKFRRSYATDAGGKKVWGHPLQSALFCPWNPDHELLSLVVVKAQCVEHHQVAWDQDPKGEKKHDGFIFAELPITLDPPSKRWFNQYPTASYGQLDDTQDRMLHLDWKGCGMSANEMIKLEDTPKGMTELHDGSHFLANVRRGQVTIAKATSWKDEDKVPAIQALSGLEHQVQELMEKAMGKKLRLMQVLYMPTADGKEPILMDWFEVVFDDEPAFIHSRWEEGRGSRVLVTPEETKV